MSILEIRTYPDEILKRPSAPVAEVTDDVRRLIIEMAETMYANDGVGLAAPQVGVSSRIIVIDVGGAEERGKKESLIALVNPEITAHDGTCTREEGCLSLPELRAEVKRHQRVEVSALDREGRPLEIAGEDLLAVALQHEIDHLNGTLFIDRLSRLKRERLTRLYFREVVKEDRISEHRRQTGGP